MSEGHVILQSLVVKRQHRDGHVVDPVCVVVLHVVSIDLVQYVAPATNAGLALLLIDNLIDICSNGGACIPGGNGPSLLPSAETLTDH